MMDLVGRHEIKHFISGADITELRARLPRVLPRDPNAGEDGIYRVRSLYFDSIGDRALREKLDGVNAREKYRLRLYNSDRGQILLEKKSKRSSLCYKQSAQLTEEQARAILSGDYRPLRESGEDLALAFYTELCAARLRPRNIVDYAREAFVYAPGNVRVTLDSDIRVCLSVKSFLAPEITAIPVPGACVLEVKYDRFLPEIVRGAVSLQSRRETAFSKYAAARLQTF